MWRRSVLVALLKGTALHASSVTRPTISLAVTDVAGLEELQRYSGAFKEAFERLVDTKLRFFLVSSRAVAVEGMTARRTDVILTGPADDVVFRARSPGVQPLIGFQRVDYFSNIVVRADSPYQVPAVFDGPARRVPGRGLHQPPSRPGAGAGRSRPRSAA
jgi:phosphonate transport system substrate-binding protein